MDFYRWTQEYTRDEISCLIENKGHLGLGRINALVPVERGASDRLVKLHIFGENGDVCIGKELEIRRMLSESHLKSSAFEISYLDAEGHHTEAVAGWERILLEGKGWGHGVGLCQIGAAVMASKGYDYKQILEHYYPGTVLSSDEN